MSCCSGQTVFPALRHGPSAQLVSLVNELQRYSYNHFIICHYLFVQTSAQHIRASVARNWIRLEILAWELCIQCFLLLCVWRQKFLLPYVRRRALFAMSSIASNRLHSVSMPYANWSFYTSNLAWCWCMGT